MRNPERVLEALRDKSNNEKYHYEKIYRNLYNKEFYLNAYAKIYSKEGNMTAGTDGQTIDGFSLQKVDELVELIKEEKYEPHPARRKYIPKKNSNKKRPLGIPAFYDKLVQEVVRQILEAIYEGSFSELSHGFRPKRSCHTALLQIKGNFTATKWWIEGDIKGFFDNIKHEVLINILRRRIKDEKFIRLIWKFLKAGYLEDFKFHQTYSGTPQGGIISPILANIYLNELDKYIERYIKEFDKGNKRKANYQYKTISENISNRRKILKPIDDEEKGKLEKYIEQLSNERKEYRNTLTHLTGKQRDLDTKYKSYQKHLEKARRKLKIPSEEERQKLISEIKSLRIKQRELFSYDQFDENYRRMKYARYADDFLIGVIGTKKDAEQIKQNIKEFLDKELKLELSDKKTLITHNSKKVRFLGYDIFINTRSHKDLLVKRKFADSNEVARTGVDSVKLSLPQGVMENFLVENGYAVKKHNGEWRPMHHKRSINNDELEILMHFNAQLRGFYQYYKFAFNIRKKLLLMHWIWKRSFGKTLANKYKTKVYKLMSKNTESGKKKFFRNGKWGVAYKAKKGEENFTPLMDTSEIKFCKKIFDKVDEDVDKIPKTGYAGRNGLLKRLLANECECCGDTEGPFQVHHIRKLKDLKGKKEWERVMIARRRKTMVLCGYGSKKNCHQRLHNGELD